LLCVFFFVFVVVVAVGYFLFGFGVRLWFVGWGWLGGLWAVSGVVTHHTTPYACDPGDCPPTVFGDN